MLSVETMANVFRLTPRSAAVHATTAVPTERPASKESASLHHVPTLTISTALQSASVSTRPTVRSIVESVTTRVRSTSSVAMVIVFPLPNVFLMKPNALLTRATAAWRTRSAASATRPQSATVLMARNFVAGSVVCWGANFAAILTI